MESLHLHGRPSVAESIAIDKILYSYYLKSYSIETAAELTGLHRRTVAKRFRKWDRKNLIKLNDEFDKGDSEHKAEYLRLNQTLIEDAWNDLENAKNDVMIARQNNDPMLPQLISIRDKIRMNIDALGMKRCAVKIRPGAERVVGKVIEARIQDHVQSISRN